MLHELAHYNHLLLFGGTFDPPHRAHVELPRLAMQTVGAQAVVYVPAGRSPMKTGQPQTPGSHRLAMLQRALADESWAIILTDELDRAAAAPDRPSYTVDTLQNLRERLGPAVRLRLLLGSDQFLLFPRWHRAPHIMELAEPLVMVRPPETRSSLLAKLPTGESPQVWAGRLLDLPQMQISASDIRQRLALGQDPQDQLHPRVLQYIRQHGLYQPE